MQMCHASSAGESHTFQQLAYIPVFLLGLLLNTPVLCVLFVRRRDWTDTHIYMLNLALANFALVLFLPVRVYNAYWPLEPSHFCTGMISIHYTNMYSSILIVTCVSVHRYLSVRFPFWVREQRTRKRIATLVCTLVWVTVVTICLGFRSENYPDKLCTCYTRRDAPLSLEFILVLETVGYLVPLVTMTFCSIQTACLLQRKERTGESSEQKKAFVRIVTANLIVFIVCYTPFHVSLGLIEYHKVDKTGWSSVDDLIHNFRDVTEWIATTNCCLDSFGYYFLLRKCLKDVSQNYSVPPENHQRTCTRIQLEVSNA